jgi:SSS family solute:Na+ symporter
MGGLSGWLLFVYAATNLVLLVEPAIYQRIFAARSFASVRNALLVGLVLWGAYDWVVRVLGMVAKTAAVQGAIDPTVSADHSLLLIMISVLPAGLVGFFVAGVLATEMSTLDSYCRVAGGNVSYDLYQPLVNLVIVMLGGFAPADDTYLLTVEWASSTREIWQEHAMLFGIPASGIGFVTGLLMDRGGADT